MIADHWLTVILDAYDEFWGEGINPCDCPICKAIQEVKKEKKEVEG